jgi:oleandomycin transport system ATP-binding protein
MIGRPAVLYLDEPTTGLDPRTRNEVWREVQRMVAEGATVLLTTQYMEEAEQLAHELVVFDRGRVIAEGRVDELKAKVGGRTLQIRPADTAALPAMAAVLTGSTPDHEAGVLNVPITSDEQLTEIIAQLGARGFAIAGIGTHLPSLDEVFLAVTGQKATAEDTPADDTSAEGTPTEEKELVA